jgi:2-polyprenyl-3-methyl-5-hydroxy-6-metoxy-1,4-benzoquinol methylase
LDTLTFNTLEAAAYTIGDQQRMSHAKNYFAWQARLVTREIGRRVIEVGCGVGNFTGALLDRDAILALDKEPGCIEELQKRYASHLNLRALICDVDTLNQRRSELGGFAADSCVCLNVLEHIADDVTALRAMSSLLAPGGVIVLLVPAFPSLYGPIDRNLGHYRRYTLDSLTRLAAETTLRVRKAHYVNCAGFFGWWLNSRILKRETQSEKQIAAFERFVPALSRLEGIARPPFGQSLFAVLETPC